MSDLITSQMLSDWRANYGLDKRTPIKAMHWWQDNMDGKAPAGVVAALGLCINEIERLTAERDELRDDNAKLNGWMEEEAQAAGRLQRKLNAAEEEIERLRQWEMCGREWQNKTDWVQQRMNSGDWPVTALGKHRADVMREEIERMTEENRRLRADLLAGRNVVNAGLTIHTLTLERDELRRQLAEAEQDARRYRWLRNEASTARKCDPMVCIYPLDEQDLIDGDRLDIAIDAVMGGGDA
jgi:hypothetical protein